MSSLGAQNVNPHTTAECQLAHWSAHKTQCKPWFDKHRKCDDMSAHFGKLELVTWSGVCQVTEGTLLLQSVPFTLQRNPTIAAKEHLGFGCVFEEEAADPKERFETDCHSDLEKFFEYRPQGFRWTCCELVGSSPYGCDHHGTGPKACTCDFCRSGERLPDDVYNNPHPSRKGLELSRGPDPRSRGIPWTM